MPKPNEREMMEITRQDNVSEKIRQAVMDTFQYKEDKLWVYLHSILVFDVLHREPKTGFRIMQAFKNSQNHQHAMKEFAPHSKEKSGKLNSRLKAERKPLTASVPKEMSVSASSTEIITLPKR